MIKWTITGTIGPGGMEELAVPLSKQNNAGNFMKHNNTHLAALGLLLAMPFTLPATTASSSVDLVTYS